MDLKQMLDPRSGAGVQNFAGKSALPANLESGALCMAEGVDPFDLPNP